MLFNSFEFIFLFLPVTVGLYYIAVRFLNAEFGIGILVAASLFFYGYWNPIYLLLILFSIIANYSLGAWLVKTSRPVALLVIGVSLNLILLAYFKYANFFVENLNLVAGTEWDIGRIVLPLAISFFTFQQISFLIDARQGKTREYNFLHYCLFVCFFPQLIAGPIVHHNEMLPQFSGHNRISPKWSDFAIGISIFAIGLFKKTVIADNLSTYVGPIYDSPDVAANVDFFLAWGSTLAYTFQLYFDFSGYSDMAIGCARMFGVKLPVNFFSPYKSKNIVEFWRRWHITLSRFLRDYLYISLGGNQRGKIRRYVNLFLTMLLGGLWHGAGWPFVVWGALHGSYLIINHAWHRILAIAEINPESNPAYRAFSWTITFLAVIVGWVYFRAPTLEHGNAILLAMLGANGAEVPAGVAARLGDLTNALGVLGISVGVGSGSVLAGNFIWVVSAGLIALLMPNVAQIFHKQKPVLFEHTDSFKIYLSNPWLKWGPSYKWAAITALLFVFGVMTLTQISEFLYFQF